MIERDGARYGYPGCRTAVSRIDGRILIIDDYGEIIAKLDEKARHISEWCYDFEGIDIDSLDDDDDGPEEYPGQKPEDIWTEHPFGYEYLLIGTL